mmetsp:Transcript_11962/g.44465  ORF Transcript_11962/g.44465 Transcript_11962/m.44465 type:complete len:252 (-) Transcript_11962:259-1014(-)
MAVAVKNTIVRLHISIHYVQGVKMPQGEHQLCHPKSHPREGQSAVQPEVLLQIPAGQVLHPEVERVVGMERELERRAVRVAAAPHLLEHVLLLHELLLRDVSAGLQSHDLQRELLCARLVPHQQDLPERAATQRPDDSQLTHADLLSGPAVVSLQTSRFHVHPVIQAELGISKQQRSAVAQKAPHARHGGAQRDSQSIQGVVDSSAHLRVSRRAPPFFARRGERVKLQILRPERVHLSGVQVAHDVLAQSL